MNEEDKWREEVRGSAELMIMRSSFLYNHDIFTSILMIELSFDKNHGHVCLSLTKIMIIYEFE